MKYVFLILFSIGFTQASSVTTDIYVATQAADKEIEDCVDDKNLLLIQAVYDANLPLVRQLLRAGANPNSEHMVDDMGKKVSESVLAHAVMQRSTMSRLQYLPHGNGVTKRVMLQEQQKQFVSYFDIIRCLLSYGANPETAFVCRVILITPLTCAAMAFDVDVVQLLASYKAPMVLHESYGTHSGSAQVYVETCLKSTYPPEDAQYKALCQISDIFLCAPELIEKNEVHRNVFREFDTAEPVLLCILPRELVAIIEQVMLGIGMACQLSAINSIATATTAVTATK
jgi:hypothetical protein